MICATLRPHIHLIAFIAALLVGAACFVGPRIPLFAATTTGTFQVSATVMASCSMTTNPLAFGTYTTTQVTATTTLSVTCTNGSPYNVGLDAGTSTGATVATRKMTGPGGALLGYSLNRDAGYTSNWGNTPGTDTVAGTGTGLAQNLTVYGQIPGGQLPVVGSFTDTITTTITY